MSSYSKFWGTNVDDAIFKCVNTIGLAEVKERIMCKVSAINLSINGLGYKPTLANKNGWESDIDNEVMKNILNTSYQTELMMCLLAKATAAQTLISDNSTEDITEEQRYTNKYQNKN